ncbi:MAG: type II toxin-antitoxin system VapC family toxin [Terracidiphilus sp.]
MEEAFWDSSALVPLCVQQQSTPVVQALAGRYLMVVWWSTPVEIRGAFARLVRMGQLTSNGPVGAQVELENFRSVWQEVPPSEELRAQAERLVDRFPLKAADAQQLAAALTWSFGRPRGRVFISGDAQLLDAARQLGFQAIEA